jgi:hypothetical protein
MYLLALADDTGQSYPGPRQAVIRNELKEEGLHQIRGQVGLGAPLPREDDVSVGGRLDRANMRLRDEWKITDWLDLD